MHQQGKGHSKIKIRTFKILFRVKKNQNIVTHVTFNKFRFYLKKLYKNKEIVCFYKLYLAIFMKLNIYYYYFKYLNV